jgi:RluA family pseudouridine synthase
MDNFENYTQKVEILYSDSALLVVNKPANLSVLPDGWEPDAPYLVQTLKKKYPELMVVHRLDKVTSGVMVFALTPEAHRALSIQFDKQSRKPSVGEAQKVYHAVCVGVPPWDEHTARHKLRINVGHSHRTVVDHAKGKPAETAFKVLKRYKNYGLLEAVPATGRTHQIRVHAYALGYPLLGDTLYSAPETDLIERPALHALSLAFIHPVSGEQMTFEAPYPNDFKQALRRLDSNISRRSSQTSGDV